MAVSKSHAPKGPSQSPDPFFKSVQQGGAYGSNSNSNGSGKQSGGPMNEKIWGRPALNKTMTGNSTTKTNKVK